MVKVCGLIKKSTCSPCCNIKISKYNNKYDFLLVGYFNFVKSKGQRFMIITIWFKILPKGINSQNNILWFYTLISKTQKISSKPSSRQSGCWNEVLIDSIHSLILTKLISMIGNDQKYTMHHDAVILLQCFYNYI